MKLSPTNYRTIRAFLTADEPVTQTGLAESTGVSLSQVNRVVTQLLETGYARRLPDGGYSPQGGPALLSHIAFQRPISKLVVGVVMVHAKPEQVKQALVREGCTLCLDSALEAYSSYFRPGRVCAYTTESPRIVDGLRPAMGGLLPVHLYEPDLPLDDDVEEGHTQRFRTLLDLICDGKTYAAKDLFQQLWGMEVT